MKRPRLYIGVIAVSAILASGVAGAAHAEDEESTDLIEALEVTAHTNAAPDVLDRVAPANEVDVDIPPSSAEPVVIGQGADRISVELPGAVAQAKPIGEGLVAYDADDGFASVPVPKDDGSVQFTSIIDSADSPTAYRYDLQLPTGTSLSMAEDGGVAVTD